MSTQHATDPTSSTEPTADNPSSTRGPVLSVVTDPPINPNAEASESLVVRENLDPATLLLDVNVRLSTAADKTLVESIREHGVLQPIIAVRAADGGVRVRYGHRRTLAAIDAGLATVPVDVIGDEDDDQVQRILTQWAENEHRAGLSTAELCIIRVGQT